MFAEYWLSALLLLSAAAPVAGAEPPAVDFTLDVYPLLQQRCLHCHGADRQEGSLRLDRREFADRGGHTGSPVLGGTVETNGILRRVTTADAAIRMPKGESPLSDAEVAVLRRWVEQGTPWVDPPETAAARARRYEWSWESLQPLDPRQWSNERFEHVRWWLYRFSWVWVLVLLWIGACDRARHWVRAGDARVQPPRGTLWRRLAATPRSLHLAVLLGLGLLCALVHVQRQGRSADDELARVRAELEQLERQIAPPALDETGPVRPIRPRHPPRLGGEYYRGNDERSPALFNGGFYRTCTMRVWLCRADDTILAWGDEVDPATTHVRFEIEQSPGTAESLFSADILNESYVSAVGPEQSVSDAARQIAGFKSAGPRRWVARLPLDLTRATHTVQEGILYVVRGALPKTGGRISTPHYAAEYAIRVLDGRLTADSELWMGYTFRTGNVLGVPAGKIAEDEWFSFRPIPEIVGGQTTQDPVLLGIEEHRPELGRPPSPAEPVRQSRPDTQ